MQPRDAPSVVVDRVKTQTDILKFSNLQQVFLEIGLTVSSTAAPWKHEHRRKMIRIARTVIEAEGFSWILPGLLEQTSFRSVCNAQRQAFLERLDPSPPGLEPVTPPKIVSSLTTKKLQFFFRYFPQFSTLMEIPHEKPWKIAEDRTLKAGSSPPEQSRKRATP